MQQPSQLCQMTIRCKERDFLAFYSTSGESWNYFPVLHGQGLFELYHLVLTCVFTGNVHVETTSPKCQNLARIQLLNFYFALDSGNKIGPLQRTTSAFHVASVGHPGYYLWPKHVIPQRHIPHLTHKGLVRLKTPTKRILILSQYHKAAARNHVTYF